jgi:hypothetical protein
MWRVETRTRPATGAFQIEVATVFPAHETSRGSPALTETSFILVESHAPAIPYNHIPRPVTAL